MRRQRLLIVITSILFFVILWILFFQTQKQFDRFVVDDEKWNYILSKRQENLNLSLESIQFNDYNLFIDESHNTIYYSYVANGTKKYEPTISYSSSNNVSLAILKEEITDKKIEENYLFSLMIYNDKEYRIYSLIYTSLPILNISYKENDSKDKNIPMEMSLFDNSDGVSTRITKSDGFLNRADEYDKNSYIFSLISTSLGRNERKNKISILQMRKHSEYVLNSMTSDSENIRSSFSLNLWNQTIGENDNYRYVELFINGRYVGLYSLGYNLPEENIDVGNDEFLFFKSKFVDSESTLTSESAFDGYILYDSKFHKIKGKEDLFLGCFDKNKAGCKRIDAWKELYQYYETIQGEDTTAIKKVIDMDNSIKIYLYYIFVQASNNVDSKTFCNTYMQFKKSHGQYFVRYYPWNLEEVFGNYKINDMVEEYHFQEDDNQFIMMDNPIYRLIELKDEETIYTIKETYKKLRENEWSTSNISNLLDTYEKDIFLSGAFLRNIQAWGGDDLSEAKLTRFQNYVIKRLEFMDQYVENL